MAEINQRSGFYGFTLDGVNGNIESDEFGNVKKCLFSIVYPLQPSDIDFTISTGDDDWGAQMPNGDIIPLKNPVVLFQNRDNSIVQFDMDAAYPSNTPCILVYREDTAGIRVTPASAFRPFTPNTISGHFAFTVEGYGGGSYPNGYVDRILATIPFPMQPGDVDFFITDNDGHWAARMGDGSMIALKDPEVIAVNRDNAIIQFTMAESYPSNSPCILVYASQDASIRVSPKTTTEFVPVDNIIGVPAVIGAGVAFDITAISVWPYNASNQQINWTLVSGNATLTTDKLTGNGEGTVVLRGTIVDGISEGNNFVKEFTISVEANTIQIMQQPPENVNTTFGDIDFKLTINAKSTTGSVSYRWYHGTMPTCADATAISGANKTSYQLPNTLSAGHHYYFCEVTSPGAVAVRSRIVDVFVAVQLTDIVIAPRINELALGQTKQLTVNQIPAEAILPTVIWSSSDPNIIRISQEGVMESLTDGDVVIKASTADGFTDTMAINVPKLIQVTDITDLPTVMDTGAPITLSGIVVPYNATYKNITWQVIDGGTTAASIIGDQITAPNVGTVRIRASIDKGISLGQPFTKDFIITVNRAFVPVTSIELVDFPADFRVGETVQLKARVIPADADQKNVLFSIPIDGATGATILNGNISCTNPGNFILKGTVICGKSSTENFEMNFNITALPPWVSVTNITLETTEYDPNANADDPDLPQLIKLKLNPTVTPANATMSDVEFTLIPGERVWPTNSQKMLLTSIGAVAKVIITAADPIAEPPVEEVARYAIQFGDNFYTCDSVGNVEGYDPSDENSSIDDITPLSESDEIFADCEKIYTDCQAEFDPNTNEVWIIGNHMKPSTVYTINIRARVLKGISKTDDYVQLIPIRVVPLGPPDIFVPIIDMKMELPNPFRVGYPALINRLTVNPWNYSKKDFTFNNERPDGHDGADCVIFNPRVENEFSFEHPFQLTTPSVMRWDLNEQYAFFYDEGDNVVSIHVDHGRDPNPDDGTGIVHFDKSFLIHAMAPYIPIANVTNIPITIPRGKEIVITPEFDTNHGTMYGIDTWDEEVPSYTDFELFLDAFHINLSEYPNTAGAEVRDGNKLYAKRNGRFTFMLYVENGQSETVSWYPDHYLTNVIVVDPIQGIKQEVPVLDENGNQIPIGGVSSGTPFTMLFDVQVVDPDTPTSDPIVTLTLQNTRKVRVYDMADLMNLCNDRDPDYEITIGSITFKKSEVVDVKFWDRVPRFTDPAIVTVNDITFNYPSTSTGLAGSSGTPASFDIVASTDEPDGTELINGGEFDGMRTLPENCFIRPDGGLVRKTTGETLILNQMYGATIFRNPAITQFPSGFTKYDNDWIKVPTGAILDEDGSIHVLNGSTLRYTVNPEGTVIDYSSGSARTLLPKGSLISSNNRVVLSTGYILNGANKTAVNLSNYTGVVIPYNAYIDTSNNLVFATGVSIDPSTAVYVSNWDVPYVRISPTSVLLQDGTRVVSGDGVYGTNGYRCQNVVDLTDGATLTPSNATNNVIRWSLLKHFSGTGEELTSDNLAKVVTMPLTDAVGGPEVGYLVPGTDAEIALIQARVPNGSGWHDQDYIKKTLINIGVSSTSSFVAALNTPVSNKIVYASIERKYVNLSASLVGIEPSGNISWSVSGNTSMNTRLYSNSGLTNRLTVSAFERDGTDITVRVSSGGKYADILIRVISEYSNEPPVSSLYNFGRNFINLTSIDRIPETVSGDDCLHNFLRGCVNFNQALTIPEGLTGDRCLMYFLRDCTSFDSNITIPDSVTGKSAMHGFLYGCTSFNKRIEIPNEITGESCLERFMMWCISFNQGIAIPSTVTGDRCLREFLSECYDFNQPIDIPEGVAGEYALYGFMHNIKAMVSTVNIPEAVGDRLDIMMINSKALSNVFSTSAYKSIGVTVTGGGADKLIEILPNSLSIPLYINLHK